MTKLWIISALCLFSLARAQFPAEGLYMSLRDDLLYSMFTDLGLQVADFANTDTTTPDVNGQTSSVSYTLSQFIYDIDIEDPTFTQNTPNVLTITYNTFKFVIQTQYHVCSNSIGICEDGYIQIWTLVPNSLAINVDMSFSGPTVFFNVTSVDLYTPEDGYEIDVDCTNTFCLIPVDDILSGVQSAFQPAFQNELAYAINTQINTYFTGFQTTLAFPNLRMDVVLTGSWGLAGSPANFISFASGQFDPDQSITPPFNPQFTPPSTVFTSPAGQLDFIFTDYMIETAVWAMDLDGDFNMTITDSELPADSPFHLTTSDPFFKQAVPGLKDYPNMDMVVTTSLFNLSSVQLTAADGIVVGTTGLAVFTLTNSTLTTPGFTLLVDIGFQVETSVSLDNGNIMMFFTPDNYQIKVSVVSSAVGDISENDFAVLFRIAISALVKPPYNATIPTPTYFTLSSPFVNIYDGYGDIGANVAYYTSPPSIECASNSTQICPEANTCCYNSNSGVDAYFCCVLPSATCCGSYCCQQGTACNDEGCLGVA